MEIAHWINAVKLCGKALSRGVIMPIEPLSLALPPELPPCLVVLAGVGG